MSFRRYTTASLLIGSLFVPVYADEKPENPRKAVLGMLDDYKGYELTSRDLLEVMTDYNITHGTCVSGAVVVAGIFNSDGKTICISDKSDRTEAVDTILHEAWHYVLRRSGIDYQKGALSKDEEVQTTEEVEKFVAKKAQESYMKLFAPKPDKQ